ncbi:nucleotide exchange factor GrpE [Thermobifida halotolerans]|uniref:Protein GrpE n=1 Tax=Thermobifida halotolerans TaxID=483545 RepID=A0A399G0R6_9ACTN|nr:nucleotide exchange factor GrpE [Thermobifida halotolerans]UOE19267.1 nucleotide exchange factor GrpE [Thermobifida halotolerans]
MAVPENEHGNEQEGPVIRDNRRIDPETGEPRAPEGTAESSSPASEAREAGSAAAETTATVDDAELARLRQEVEERTSDLKRLQAEYVNYRKRVERDRVAVREQALSQVLGELLPILDDIGRARAHDELVGGFKSVGEALEALVSRLGLKKYAEKGDEFDPTVHEALTMVPSPDVTVPTVIEVFQPGYLMGERVVRPARVVVAGPAEEEADASAEASGTTGAAQASETAETSGEPEENTTDNKQGEQ